MSAAILAELRAMRRDLKKLRRDFETTHATEAARDGAVKRRAAAKLMGIGLTKLQSEIDAGKVRTTTDKRRIPMSEVRRYNAPKEPRRAPRRYDRVPDARDEARLVRESLRGTK